MDFKQAVVTCLRHKYVAFGGRAGRREFWWFFLFQVIVLMVAGMFGDRAYALVTVLLILPGLAAGARRLHDTGKSGWFLLLGLVPLAGFVLLLYFWVQPSGPANEWGAGPYEPQRPALPPGAV